MKVKSESEVAQSCPTLSDPMYCSLPGSSVHGIFQARVLEWGDTAFSGSPILIVYSIKYIEVDFRGFNQEDRLTTRLPVPKMIGEVESSFCILYNYYMNS